MLKRTKENTLTLGYLTLLNTCVFIMFAVLLTPVQPSPVVATAAVASRDSITLSAPSTSKRPIIGTAGRVIVPSVGIEQEVRPGSYDIHSNSWTVDSLSAFHATTTVPVNNANGTSLIYGHAEWKIFGRLPETQPGAEAFVDTIEGQRFIYEFESSRQVEPTDTSALTASGPPKLLLQTCSGPFDAYRTLVTFKLRAVVNNE